MESKLFASNRILNETIGITTKSLKELVDILQIKHSTESSENFVSFMSNVHFHLENFSKFQNLGANSKYIDPLVLNFGTYMKHGKTKNKEIFLIPLEKTINLYWNDPLLKSKLDAQVNDEKSQIKLALYHDEITIVNPIGNFIF